MSILESAATSALLHIREMSSGYVARPEDVVNVGDQIEARIIELSRRRQRVDLSIKGLRPEPEVELPPEAEAAEAVQSTEDEVVDEFADVEVLSPMELAFKRAMEAEGIEIDTSKRKRRKGKRGVSIQDEIIARTLGVSDN
ncbi:MAG: S1 RNA-binding domain-containing protein [Caldilineaceae bacterium]